MGRPRFAFFSALSLCLVLARVAGAGISFVGAEPLTVSPQPQYMLAGDLNNDQRSDIVVIAPGSHEVDVYLAAGADTPSPSYFAPARAVPVGTTLGNGALGDLNGDGNLDLVVTDIAGRNVWVLLGQGDGTFALPYRQVGVPKSKHPIAVAIGNFDSSGHNDLAVADSQTGQVFILRNDNNAPPNFLQGGAIELGLAPTDVRAVDLNGDGHPDILVLNLGGPRVKELDSILWTGVTLGFPVFDTPQKFVIGANPSSMVVADFDNDGLPDVAMLNRPAGTGPGEIDVLLNAGNGVFNPPTVIPVPCPFPTGGEPCKLLGLVAADFDGNGDVDLVVALSNPLSIGAAGSDAIQVFGGRGDGTFAPGGVTATEKGPESMAVGDITGDGAPDIAIANSRTLNLQAFVNVSAPGTTDDGKPCAQDGECLSDRCTNSVCCAERCNVANNEFCNVPGREGACVVVPPAATTCTATSSTCPFCVDGYCCDESCQGGRCDQENYHGVCVPLAKDGESCSAADQCVSGICSLRCCSAACNEGFCDNVGTCHPLSANGTPCGQNAECQSNICDPAASICCNSVCDQSTQVCFQDQGMCQSKAYTPGPGTPGFATPERTPTATPRLTPAPVGMSCSIPHDCSNGQCVDGVCCQTAGHCPAGQQCQMGTGVCVDVTATPTGTPTTTALPTSTISPTPPDPTPTPDPCGDPSICPNGEKCEVINGAAACVSTSSSGGCSTAGDDPARGNLAVAALLPLALWAGRRWRLRRVRVRSRAPRQ